MTRPPASVGRRRHAGGVTAHRPARHERVEHRPPPRRALLAEPQRARPSRSASPRPRRRARASRRRRRRPPPPATRCLAPSRATSAQPRKLALSSPPLHHSGAFSIARCARAIASGGSSTADESLARKAATLFGVAGSDPPDAPPPVEARKAATPVSPAAGVSSYRCPCCVAVKGENGGGGAALGGSRLSEAAAANCDARKADTQAVTTAATHTSSPSEETAVSSSPVGGGGEGSGLLHDTPWHLSGVAARLLGKVHPLAAQQGVGTARWHSAVAQRRAAAR